MLGLHKNFVQPMHNIDNTMHSDELHGHCSSYDYEVVLGIQNATKTMAPFSFGYFDLGLSEYEQDLLNNLDVTYFNAFLKHPDSSLDSVEKDTQEFIKSISSEGKNNAISIKAAQIITRIIQNIIGSSSFDAASVYMSSDLSWNMDYKTDFFYNTTSHDWHIDKTLRESITPSFISPESHLVYIFTLKGSSTLYYNSDIEFHNKFLSKARDVHLVFGCARQLGCMVDDMFDLSQASSASSGQGSVHFSGKNFGTFHTAPHPHERIFVIVVPEDRATIDQYYKIASSITY